MANAQINLVLRHLRGFRETQVLTQVPDALLLERFAIWHEEAAFGALLRRHGPMVLSVSRRVLRSPQDAEDVFQGTFLLLVRKAASIRKRESVGSWLHGVAHRLALKAREKGFRRRVHEKRAADMRDTQPNSNVAWHEIQAALDGALQALPERYRTALVLCYLEGKSHAEVAQKLDCPLPTIRARILRGRKLLRDRLTSHGFTLSTAGIASLLLASAAPAAAPVVLVKATFKAALAIATGQAAAAVCSAQVAGLVEEGLRTMCSGKVKVALAIMLVTGIVSAACGLAYSSAADDEAKGTKAKPAEQESRVKQDAVKDQETISCSGRVLDPEGNPVRGANLMFLEYISETLPHKVWATSGTDGQFKFTVDRIRMANRQWGMPGDEFYVMAAAQGFGFAVAPLSKPAQAADLTLRLVKDDEPIRGRVLTLEGKPIAGVRVSINDLEPYNQAPLYAPKKGDLTAWLAALKTQNKDAWELERTYFTELYCRAPDLVFSPVKTDGDGRFEMRGIGRERLVHLRLEGPTIATQLVSVMTRQKEKVCVPLSVHNPSGESITYYGAAFEVLTQPTKPVVGIVRDKETGKPLAGVTITPSRISNPYGISNYNQELIRTTTDKDGRYRLVGLPKGEDNQLLATTNDLPYIPAGQKVENTTGLEAVTVDFALRRGIWVKGRVTEKTTGKPLSGGVGYYCFNDNPQSVFARSCTGCRTQDDGSFRVVALPGPGLIAVQVAHNNRYRSGVGADQVKGPRVNTGIECFDTSPFPLQICNMNTIVEIAPKPGEDSITCDLVVVPGAPGRTLTGTLLGPDDKPLTDVLADGARVDGDSFTVEGLKPKGRRLIHFRHEDKKLAGFFIVKADDKGPLRVRLEPWGTLTGQVITTEGDSLAGVGSVKCIVRDGSVVHHFDLTSQLDKKGRFRIEGLAPGVTYELDVSKQGYAVDIISGESKDLTIKAGQTMDLGVVKVKVKE
jgi:RNA polymerase sigma factor (sigma-70 family)